MGCGAKGPHQIKVVPKGLNDPQPRREKKFMTRDEWTQKKGGKVVQKVNVQTKQGVLGRGRVFGSAQKDRTKSNLKKAKKGNTHKNCEKMKGSMRVSGSPGEQVAYPFWISEAYESSILQKDKGGWVQKSFVSKNRLIGGTGTDGVRKSLVLVTKGKKIECGSVVRATG